MAAVAPIAPVTQPAEGSLDDRICQFLVARGRLKETDLVRGRRLHEEDPASGSLVSLLTRLGLVSEREMAEGVSELLALPLLSAKEFPETPPANVQTSVRFLKHHHICPIGESDSEVTLLVADPADRFPMQALELATGRTVKLNIGMRSEIDDLIERYYGSGRSAMGTIVENLTDDNNRSEDDIEHLRDLASEAPVIRLVNLIIQRAVEQRASDIHVEPFENRLKVRYRIDGVLHEVESPPAASTAAVISRVKIMAKLNIAERRLPQDGRIMIRVQGKELDLRVSTVPTAHGESVVMRILDREAIVFDFHTLGFTDQFLSKFINVLELPHGIMLVTGPTGSGKTTTLYTALSKLNTPDVKIITVEDPIEYQIEGINQIQAKPTDRSRLLARAALDRASGSGHHHDRRNARSGNRAHRDPVRADRTPGVVDAAHEQRGRRHHAHARHGRGGLPADLDGQRHPRAAPRASARCNDVPGVRTAAGSHQGIRSAINSPTRGRSICTSRARRSPTRPATTAARRSWNSWS